MAWIRDAATGRRRYRLSVNLTRRTGANAMANPLTVWVVEDDRLLRETIAELVDERPDLHCDLAVPTCEAALEHLNEDHVPQVVLMDLGLPGMDGIEGTRRMLAISPASRVIVLTIHDDDERVFDALCAGATGYLLKPAGGDQIIGAIETAVAGGAPMNAFVARRVIDAFAGRATARQDSSLTRRERDILGRLAEDKTQKQIAQELFVSPHTVDTHVRNIYAKLHVHSRSGAVARALRDRLI
jgi:DNA-binding NarL/FixJ family response regulator